MSERLLKQLEFVREIDKIKTIFRQSTLFCEARKENDAEHSWHICVMTLLLSEYAEKTIDTSKVIKMLLIHDLVEIDAGDTIVYGKTAADELREQEAADRIFGMLPADQAVELRALWDEFEARNTNESRFAAAMDRLEPMMMNLFGKGCVWREHKIRLEQVLKVNKVIGEGAPKIWEWAEDEIRRHPYWSETDEE